MPILLPPPAATAGPGTPGELIHTGTVEIGEVSLGVTDDYGVEWVLESLKGWSNPAPSTGSTEQRSSDHGGWNSAAYYAPRLIEITGTLFANDWAAANDALDRLYGAIPLDTPGWLYVDEGDRYLQTRVRQEGDLLTERLSGWARFSLSLIAADPRRYSIDQTTQSTGLGQTTGGLSLPITFPLTIGATVSSGRLSLLNEGNMSTRPVLAITGPCPPATITHIGSSKRLLVPEAVPAGRTLVLDADSRSALLDGVALRYVTGSWFDLDPGRNEVQFEAISYDADAQLSATFRSAWR